MSTFPYDHLHSPASQPMDIARRKQQSQQPRQLLSCTKCRERKVKCDRTKPCSACCARGAPKECHFVAEGGDYAPIQQSYELRKLRAENLRLKERLRSSRISIDDDDSDQSSGSQLGEKYRASSNKRRTARQKRFQGSEWSDSIYFGSPGLANIVTDFACVSLGSDEIRSLTHHLPRGSDIFTPKSPSSYPFATLFPATPEECIPQLLDILPCRKELLDYLAAFEKRVYVCDFPHLPIELSRSEIERFLSDAERNARMCPDMLALIFAAIALGAQHSVWDKSGEQWKAEAVNLEAQRGNVYVAASMQALRISSFMHKPSLLAIKALIMIGPFLSNSGRFLDAWTLFGTTIRLAQAIGLHRHPKYLDPAPPTQAECSIRQTLWWWMLHMDEQYSMILGRPLGISGIGDCPPPHELTTNPQMLRLGEFVNHFTILARQILSSDRLSNSKIDEFTDLLLGLLDTMPEMLQFGESWLDGTKPIPEWPLGALAAVYYCKTHTYLMLLNRQRTDKLDVYAAAATKPSPAFRAVNKAIPSHNSPTASTPDLLRGRPLVLSSSAGVLTAFLFFYSRVPLMLISWSISQEAFNSSMILLLDALETGSLTHLRRIEQAYVIFRELQDNGIHKLAGIAVEKLSWGLDQLRKGVRGLDSHQCPEDTGSASPFQREAEAFASAFPDTIMGNTGLLLPDEPGLQSHTRECFAPFTWVTERAESEATTPSQMKQEQELQPSGKVESPGYMRLKSSFEVTPAQGELQANVESRQRSASVRYCTLPPQELSQPQRRVTGLASPMSLAESISQQNPNDDMIIDHPRSRKKQSPHSRHGAPQRTTPTTTASGIQSLEAARDGSNSVPQPGKWVHHTSTAKDPRVSAAQLRHNSCPSLQHMATTPPHLRTTYSSPLSNQAQSPVCIEHYGQWSASHTAAVLGSPEPGMLLSPISGHGHTVPIHRDESFQQQQMEYQRLLLDSMAAAQASAIPATTLEQSTVDQWKRWASSGAPR